MKIRKFLLLNLIMILLLTSCDNTAAKWKEKYDAGVKSYEAKNYLDAVSALTEAIEIDSKISEAFSLRGRAYVQLNNSEETLGLAVADFESALKLKEINSDAWLGLADVAIRKGEFDNAKSILEEALVKTENDTAIQNKYDRVSNGSIVDSSGNIRRRTFKDGSGLITGYHDITYDVSVRKSSVSYYAANGTLISSLNFEYDEAGREIASYWMSESTGEIGQIKTAYDDTNRLSSTWYNIDGSKLYYFEYDANGYEVRKEKYSENESLLYYNTFDYDDSGKMTKSNMYNGTGGLWWYTLYEYTDAGKISKETRYDQDGAVEEYTIYSYDANGKYKGFEKYDKNDNLIGADNK